MIGIILGLLGIINKADLRSRLYAGFSPFAVSTAAASCDVRKFSNAFKAPGSVDPADTPAENTMISWNSGGRDVT